jgi:hypothetical protein
MAAISAASGDESCMVSCGKKPWRLMNFVSSACHLWVSRSISASRARTAAHKRHFKISIGRRDGHVLELFKLTGPFKP